MASYYDFFLSRVDTQCFINFRYVSGILMLFSLHMERNEHSKKLLNK